MALRVEYNQLVCFFENFIVSYLADFFIRNRLALDNNIPSVKRWCGLQSNALALSLHSKSKSDSC